MSDFTLIPSKFLDITPSDSAPVNASLGLYIGTNGIVKLVGADGVIATFRVGDGQYLTGRIQRVMATGTTATGIVALFV